MASGLDISTRLSDCKITSYDFDPNVDTPVDVAWVDMEGFGVLTVCVFHSVGADQIDTFAILANSSSTGGGTDVTVTSHAGAGVATFIDAVGDYAFLECTAAQVAQEAADAGVDGARYVSVSLELGTATDECVVMYILSSPRWAYADLTTDYIS